MAVMLKSGPGLSSQPTIINKMAKSNGDKKYGVQYIAPSTINSDQSLPAMLTILLKHPIALQPRQVRQGLLMKHSKVCFA